MTATMNQPRDCICECVFVCARVCARRSRDQPLAMPRMRRAHASSCTRGTNRTSVRVCSVTVPSACLSTCAKEGCARLSWAVRFTLPWSPPLSPPSPSSSRTCRRCQDSRECTHLDERLEACEERAPRGRVKVDKWHEGMTTRHGLTTPYRDNHAAGCLQLA